MSRTSTLFLMIFVLLTGMASSSSVSAQTPDIDWYASNPGATSFTISTADELAGLAAIVNGTWGGEPERDGFAGKTVKLIADIDLFAYDNWMPIGVVVKREFLWAPEAQKPFSGTFDGNSYIISNLTIDRPSADCEGLFGYISSGRVENLGLNGVDISARGFIGGIAGYLTYSSSVINSYSNGAISSYETEMYARGAVGGVAGYLERGSSITNCYSTGTISGSGAVGGVAGQVESSNVTNCYSTGSVSGSTFVGGIVGLAGLTVGITNCYSTGAVSGTYAEVGGIAGCIGHSLLAVIIYNSNSYVQNCAALNPHVKGMGNWRVKRVVGSIYNMEFAEYGAGIQGNVAYAEMTNNSGNTEWLDKDLVGIIGNRKDGIDITAGKINADGTINSLFVNTNVWTTEPGRLPGLFGETVEMPAHLKAVAVASRDRVIPQNNRGGDDVAVVAPVNKLTAVFTAGPNPVTKSAGMINFYYDTPNTPAGTTVPDLPLGISGVLTIYSASGNVVNKIKITPNDCRRGGNLPPATFVQAKRQIGLWDLTDKNGSSVSEGTYLVRGVLKLTDGKTEKVSLVLGVR